MLDSTKTSDAREAPRRRCGLRRAGPVLEAEPELGLEIARSGPSPTITAVNARGGGERADERQRSPWALQAADGEHRGVARGVAGTGSRQRRRSESRRSLGTANACQPRGELGLGDADRHRRQRRQRPLGPPVQRGSQAGVSENAQPWTVKKRIGTRVASGETAEHAGLRAARVQESGRSRRRRATSSTRPRRSRPGLSGRRTCSRATKRAPARAASRSGPAPYAATTTSNRSTSAGSSEATYDWAPPTSASVTTIRIRGRRRTVRLVRATLRRPRSSSGSSRSPSSSPGRATKAVTPRPPGIRAPSSSSCSLRWCRRRASGACPRPAVRATALFAAFTLWCFLSIAWADSKGDAWDGANRTLLFFTVYTLFACLRWRPREAALLLAVFAVATAALGSWVFLAAAGDGGESGFLGGRLAEPVGYANANAGLFLFAFWPAAVFASKRETPWPARGLLLATTGALLQLFGLLAQSRGSLPAFALALVLYAVLVPDRARSLLTLLLVASATVLSLPRLLEVYRADPGVDLQQALAAARTAFVFSAVLLAAAGVAVALLDRRWRRRQLRTGTPRLARLVVGAVVVVALGVAVTSVAREAGGGALAARGDGASGRPTSRLSDGLATGRYDLWRVAALELAHAPLTGVGADNFAVDYARERHTREEPLYPHSIELRLLSQTGLVGTGLFAGFLAFAVAAALRSRRIDAGCAAVAAAGLVSFSYWFAHGSIDWLWEIPALAAPAVAWLGLAGGTSRPDTTRPSPARRPRAGRPRARGRRSRRSVGLVRAARPRGAGRRNSHPRLAGRSRRRARPARAGPPAQRAERGARRRRRSPRASPRRSQAGERGLPPGARPRFRRLVSAAGARGARSRGGTTDRCAAAPRAGAKPESARAEHPRPHGLRPPGRPGSRRAGRAHRPAGHGVAARSPAGRLPAGARPLCRLRRKGGP